MDNKNYLHCKLRFLIDNYYFIIVYLCILLILLYNNELKNAIIYVIVIMCIVFYAFMCSPSASLPIRMAESYIIYTILLCFVFYLTRLLTSILT